MVERLREAGNKQVKYTEFPEADHATANAAVFSSVELVDWMLSKLKSARVGRERLYVGNIRSKES